MAKITRQRRTTIDDDIIYAYFVDSTYAVYYVYADEAERGEGFIYDERDIPAAQYFTLPECESLVRSLFA